MLIALLPAPLFAATAEDLHDRTGQASDRVLLVKNLESPISCSVADDYARQRSIKNIVTVKCVDSARSAGSETISVEDYTEAVQKPVLAYLSTHPDIDFIVLTKGIPIRVRGGETGNQFGDGTRPSLDGLLASSGYAAMPDAKKFHFTGGDARGYAWSNRYWNATVPFSHKVFGGYLVTRLDGYTEADAEALVSRALESERRPPSGKILLDIQPGFGMGDKSRQPAPSIGMVLTGESAWSEFNADMAHAADVLTNRNIPVELDVKPEFVGERKDLMGYFSWGSNDSHFISAAYQSLYFAPGAVCDTAVSTSARTFLPTQGGQSLITDLIAHGVTGVKGYIDEPWLQAIASPTIVLDRYTAGFNLAESFYAGSRFLGWEDIVVGDPLCCPYTRH